MGVTVSKTNQLTTTNNDCDTKGGNAQVGLRQLNQMSQPSRRPTKKFTAVARPADCRATNHSPTTTKSISNSPSGSKRKRTTPNKQTIRSAGNNNNKVSPQRRPFSKSLSNKPRTTTSLSTSNRESAFLQVGVHRRERAARSSITTAAMLSPGPDLLERAQRVTQTVTGFPVTTGVVSELFTAEEQAQVARCPETPYHIGYLMQEPFNRMSVIIPDQLGLTGVGGLVVERVAMFSPPVRLLMNVTYEAPLFKLDGGGVVETIRVPVADSPTEDVSIFFDAVCDKLEQVRLGGGSSIVHCMGGVSRSATFVIAYLMRYHNKSLESAFVQVKQARPLVRPNLSFLDQLGSYERRLKPPEQCAKWSDHQTTGKGAATKRLPDFIIEHYPDEY